MNKTLKQRDLQLALTMGGTVNSVILSPIEYKNKTYYEVSVNMNTLEGVEEYSLITVKNRPQRWSSINKATETIKSLIPSLNEVIVKL